MLVNYRDFDELCVGAGFHSREYVQTSCKMQASSTCKMEALADACKLHIVRLHTNKHSYDRVRQQKCIQTSTNTIGYGSKNAYEQALIR